MDKRLRKTVRLLKVQEQLQRNAEWKLANLHAKADELQNAQQALIQTLNDDEALHGLFVESRARRLQVLAVEASNVEKALEEQRKTALERAMQVKRTERFVDTLALENRRATEKKEYLALLDNLAAKSDASLP